MPLTPSVLQAGLYKALSAPFPTQGLSAAKKIAEAYDKYAATASAGPYIFVRKGTEPGLMVAALAPALAAPMGTGATVAGALASGLAAYWTGATFPPAVSTAPVVAGLPVLTAGLTILFSVPNNPLKVVVDTASALLDACTRTVLVVDPTTGVTAPLL